MIFAKTMLFSLDNYINFLTTIALHFYTHTHTHIYVCIDKMGKSPPERQRPELQNIP